MLVEVLPPAVPVAGAGSGSGGDPADLCDELQRAMTRGAGVVRTSVSLEAARAAVAEVATRIGGADDRPALEAANLVTVAAGSVAMASARTESRGAHTCDDHPGMDPVAVRRFVVGPGQA